MIDGRKLILAVISGLVLTAVVHADMVLMSKLNVQKCNSQAVCNNQDNKCTHTFNSIDFCGADDLYPLSGQFLPETNINFRQAPQRQNSIVLKNEQSSLVLCLSALIGMGFCGSAHWMKKHSFGFIPEWYHSGGPHQIGHSFAVTPDLLRTAPAFCFIPPVYTVEDSMPQYRLGTVMYLWRKSQFMSTVLASRAPPNMS